ncbi:MAG TPA: EpsI family protein [Bryobacteraceae bacterium]|nr:EpsI family protein [Bryobacteraceae bacterium]
MSFLESKFARVLTILLAVQAIVLHTAISRPELTPVIHPLASFPSIIAGWRSVEDVPIEQEVLDLLKADDTLNRLYAAPSGKIDVNLFIAFFKTQREGQSPHSPKNCLPGNGWQPVETGLVSIPAPGRPQPIVANRYVASHGDDKAVVIYWYQSHNRIIASEYSAKLWLIADSIRYHRSDTALVKIVVPVVNENTEAATKLGVSFVEAMFPALSRELPR